MTEQRPLMSIYDVAALLDVHPDTVRNLVRSGHLRAVRIGVGPNARFRISQDDLDHYLDASRVAA